MSFLMSADVKYTSQVKKKVAFDGKEYHAPAEHAVKLIMVLVQTLCAF